MRQERKVGVLHRLGLFKPDSSGNTFMWWEKPRRFDGNGAKENLRGLWQGDKRLQRIAGPYLPRATDVIFQKGIYRWTGLGRQIEQKRQKRTKQNLIH